MTRASSALIWFALVLVASVGLYRTSDRVQALNRQIRDTNAAMETERQSLRILKAEWVYLANPARVEALAKKHLALQPVAARKITRLTRLADVLPVRHDPLSAPVMMAAAPPAASSVPVPTPTIITPQVVEPAPVANLRTTLAALPPRPTATNPSTHVLAAAADTRHLVDHMVIQRSASLGGVSGDPIGLLISQLESRR